MDSLGPLVVCGEYVLDVYLKQSYAVFSGEKPTRISAIEQYLCIAVVDCTDLTLRPPPTSARSTGRALMAASGCGARIPTLLSERPESPAKPSEDGHDGNQCSNRVWRLAIAI